MMRVTFLGHSGFLMESESVCLLFDWSEGELPPLPEKPLFVFASHRHQDHFQPRIFLWITPAGKYPSSLAVT